MKIVAKVPMRVSLFGGGSDIPPYCNEKGGEILFCTINKYAYCEIENISEKEIILGESGEVYQQGDTDFSGKYGIVKAVLHEIDMDEGYRITIHSDVLQGTGLGGSSAQMAAVILAVYSCKAEKISKKELAKQTYYIEREVMGIKGGYQDPIATVYGGIGYLKIQDIEHFEVTSLALETSQIQTLRDSLLLYYTGNQHNSSMIMGAYINKQNTDKANSQINMDEIKHLAMEGKMLLECNDINAVGKLLDQAWMLKKNMCSHVSSEYIEHLYEKVMGTHALGGKILGAGGGGYLLIFSEPIFQKEVMLALETEKGNFDTEWNFDLLGARLV